MNLYGYVLRGLVKSMLGWCLGVCAFTAMFLAIYPVFRSLGFDIGEVLSLLPPHLQAFFGASGLDSGFFAGYLGVPIKLGQELCAVGGLVVGTFAAAREYWERCGDFLYTKPLSRSAVLTAKLVALATCCAVLFGVFAAFLMGMSRLLAPSEVFPPASALASAALPALMFGLYAAAGLLLGTVFPSVRGVAAIGIGIMLLYHLIFGVGMALTRDPDAPLVRALVPVCLFDQGLAAQQGVLETPYVLLWCVAVGLLLVLCYLALGRRDIE